MMKITAAVCTYNGEKYILEQLNSILNQTVKVDEIIICDDQSSDKTVTIITDLMLLYPEIIKLYINPENLRVNKNFEKAVDLSSGDFIFFSDQDDVWTNTKVAHILTIFEENPSAQGVFSDANLIDEKGLNQGTTSLWENVLFVEKAISSEKDLYPYISNIRNMVTGATLCIKKDTKEHILPFPEVKAMYHDEWIALVLAYKNTLFYTNEKLISYRIHASQQIGVIKPSVLAENNTVITAIIEKKYPKKFHQLYLIYKSYFRNYNKFTLLKNSYSNKVHFDLETIIQTNKNNIIALEPKLKSSNFVLFYFKKLTDKITGKRQFN